MALIKETKSKESKPLNHRITNQATREFNLAYNNLEKEAIRQNIQISKGAFLGALITRFATKLTIEDIQ